LPVIVGYTCSWAGDQSCDGNHKVSRDFYCAPNDSKAKDDPDDDDKVGDGDANMTVTAAPPPYDSHPFPVTPSSTLADDDDEAP